MGASGDVPTPGDYNGDGKTDLAIFRPSTGAWWVWYTGSTMAAFQWGDAGDIPVPGDYNGDGKTDLALFRPSDGTWWVWYSGTTAIDAFRWGAVGDVPVVGDFNGDGKTDLAVFRPSTGTWWIWYTGSTVAAFQWGARRRRAGARGLRWRRHDRPRDLSPFGRKLVDLAPGHRNNCRLSMGQQYRHPDEALSVPQRLAIGGEACNPAPGKMTEPGQAQAA